MATSTTVQQMTLPLHIQRLESVLNLQPYLREVDGILNDRSHLISSFSIDQSVLKSSPEHQFNFSHVTPERQWVKDLLLSDTDESGSELSESEKLQLLLELQYKRRKQWKNKLKRLNKIRKYQYFSAGLLLHNDKYPDMRKKEEPSNKRKSGRYYLRNHEEESPDLVMKSHMIEEEPPIVTELQEKEREEYRIKLWTYIVKKEIPRMAKLFSQSRHIAQSNNKKVALHCQREVRRWASKSQKHSKESSSVQPRARRVMKEVLGYWRKYEKVEKEARKKAEKEAQEQQKLYDEMREARRQQRKLNFLITQTELYAHFMSKKFTGADKSTEDILKKLEDKPLQKDLPQAVMNRMEENDEYDSEVVKAQALVNVQTAVEKQKAQHNTFFEAAFTPSSTGGTTDLQQSFDQNFSLADPSLQNEDKIPQPSIFIGELKAYQLKGMNWLASLYDQGINGILADEMGLGKTVQSIALLGHLAEHQNIWGPFLIVSPASTLHNWQQECTRFLPAFKVLPYWGNPHERKVIRKYWNQKLLSSRNAPFHVLITSYQLVVQDFKYFQRLKWQYMILDEAQAIKSSSSVRWKMLMSFNCRNRLLLTGTPIQNTMAELWALLHFIMPTMFDSHEEFSEWFSKDIENHAERKSALDENQLSRLHMILKPFMLRRIKKDVEHEMAEKIEVHLSCGLSTRQRELYRRLRDRISIDDLLHSSSHHTSKDSTSTLMNLVMQFRKVCNHPDLFECRDVYSPLNFALPHYHIPHLVYHLPSLYLNNRVLNVVLGVASYDYSHKSSLLPGNGLWGFLRHFNMSPSEAVTILLGDICDKLRVVMQLAKALQIIYLQRLWKSSNKNRCQLLLWPNFPLSSLSIADSPVLLPLLFTSHTSTFHSHCDHLISHVRTRSDELDELKMISSTVSSTRNGGEQRCSNLNEPMRICSTNKKQRIMTCVPTYMPKFLLTVPPKVQSRFLSLYTCDRGAEYVRCMWEQGGSKDLRQLFLHGFVEEEEDNVWLTPPIFKGLDASHPIKGWASIHIPYKECMITDSGKMLILDKLLAKLKRDGHRVLVYSQMTRMIDILEDFMTYRRHKYIRLDGSSRISDRRDMVDDFQSRSDIFVFLLSTRAGGLGINLTAADTVIFYDSDWNPTVDQQAMDRAHRLGQTKQVTVYRLIVKGSIEERILQRANEKSEIQKMVISGGDFKIDTLKPKEVVSLLLDDEEMETRFLTKQAEKKAQEENPKAKGTKTRKRKLVTKSFEGTPPAKRTPHSSPSHSTRPESSASVTMGNQLNGDYVDVVGMPETNAMFSQSNHMDITPLKIRKRSAKVPKGQRKKHAGPLGSAPPSKSPSNSFPSSPISLSSSALNNGASTHSSPRGSPYSSSVPPTILVTPPLKKSTPTRKNKTNSSLH